LGRVKPTGYRSSPIARSGLLAVAFFTALVMACGSSDSSGDSSSLTDTANDAALTSQPTDSSLSETAAPDDTPTVKSATPNPSSTTEIVFAPDFELPQAGGGTVRLSDIYSSANTILVFYRGYF